ncbi:serine-rich coiled-coil domain-containing protein 2 isoform X2 [Myripristis murdjan]|uniref:serine-rich coiled-coil domain-containing protein 2 isoform X2 n=1 Tax=Myripristis murdjan TaxID=586833 RepID=UPI0011762A19|nr:serine-rich coiled-coil domain-containing protein 2 isoform X2 [Myripristis murdjan]
MEEKAPIRSAMVSRLPKFGGRSSTGGSSPLPNGASQASTPTQECKTTPAGTCPNGMVHTSPFSLKWKRDGGNTPTTPVSPDDGDCKDKAQASPPSYGKEVKNASPGTPRMRRSGSSMVSISSPKAIPKQAAKTSPKAGTKLAQSPMNGGPKLGKNGFSFPAQPGSLSSSESRLMHPRASSGSPRSSSQDSLSQSSDSLKTLAVDNMVRSNSFTHFKQIPSPTNQPMIRSFSFNRAVELAKPLANTQLRPPRSSFLKPPQLSNGRVGLGLGGLGGSPGGLGGLGGLQYSRTSLAATSLSSASTTPTPSTPSALRKPLLPSCVLGKPSGSNGGSLGYRLARSGQAKQQKPLFTGRVKGDVRPSTAPECRGIRGLTVDMEPTGETEKTDSRSDSDGSSGGGGEGGGGLLRESSGQVVGEALEDMSLSSASSLDRGDTSEDCLDEFDNLGDALSDGDLTDNMKSGSDTQNRLRSFLSETMDWASMGLPGCKEPIPVQESLEPQVLSSEGGDLLQGSSLEMSPSNSSGGTYMWDEEGLEPLGGPGTHPCDSYDDSELNSMDILNNLDPLGTGELDDDDLMLDVDLPEDGLLDADRMAHIERSERAGRQGHWRRKQHRWNGPDHLHNDSRAPVFQHYDGFGAPGSFRISSRPVPSAGRQDGHMLDDLTLKHMAQDCSSLKNQLLRLRTLLQLEDPGSPADVVEESEDSTTALQLEELMKEVRVLREELSSRDKTIAQLTLQCQQLQQQQREQTPTPGRQGRCHCNHQRASSSLRQSDRRTHQYDKATQTHWRTPNYAGVLPTPLLSPWQAQHQGSPRTSMPQRRLTSNTTAFQPLPQRAPPAGKTSKNSPHRGPQ